MGLVTFIIFTAAACFKFYNDTFSFSKPIYFCYLTLSRYIFKDSKACKTLLKFLTTKL